MTVAERGNGDRRRFHPAAALAGGLCGLLMAGPLIETLGILFVATLEALTNDAGVVGAATVGRACLVPSGIVACGLTCALVAGKRPHTLAAMAGVVLFLAVAVRLLAGEQWAPDSPLGLTAKSLSILALGALGAELGRLIWHHSRRHTTSQPGQPTAPLTAELRRGAMTALVIAMTAAGTAFLALIAFAAFVVLTLGCVSQAYDPEFCELANRFWTETNRPDRPERGRIRPHGRQAGTTVPGTGQRTPAVRLRMPTQPPYPIYPEPSGQP